MSLVAPAWAFFATDLFAGQAGPGMREGIEREIAEAAQPLFDGGAIGVSVAIVQDGRTRSFHYGNTGRGQRDRPADDTIYAIGSLSKTFTGTLLAQAVLDGKLTLEDDVRSHLADSYPDLEYEGQPIRLWQLMNHTSGLPTNLPISGSSAIANVDAAQLAVEDEAVLGHYGEEAFLRDLHDVELSRIPGERFGYSNAGVQLAGIVLGKAYGLSYDDLVRSRITAPLGMLDTVVRLSPEQMGRFAWAQAPSGRFRPFLSTTLPAAGSLKSTASDMSKYLTFQLEEGEAARLTHAPAGTTTWSADGSYTVGLGWQVLTSSGTRRVFQEGQVPGFRSLCVLYPERGLGMIALVNETAPTSDAKLSSFVDQVVHALGDEP